MDQQKNATFTLKILGTTYKYNVSLIYINSNGTPEACDYEIEKIKSIDDLHALQKRFIAEADEISDYEINEKNISIEYNSYYFSFGMAVLVVKISKDI